MTPAAAEMLDPALFANVMKPPLEAESLPAWCYTDPDFHRLEIERLFMKVWNFVGRDDLMPDGGDYLASDDAGIPNILIRGGEGIARA